MNKILVTGGAGFIGSHTSLLLLEKGFEIIVIDSFINSSQIALERVVKILASKKIKNKLKILKGDLRDYSFLKNVFLFNSTKSSPINAVIHFAGLKSVNESMKDPLKYWDFNVYGTLNLLKVMEENKCRTLIFSSSATIYGISSNTKIDENCEILPINPYGKTKATVEKILHDLFHCSIERWKISNLRYFNPIGAHYSGLIGENPCGTPNNIFPIITQVAIGNIEKLEIFGNDWPTKDGTGVRDYIHVMDVAEGHFLALQYLQKNNPQILNLNLGTGFGTSVIELVKTFQEVNKVKIPFQFSKRREGDYPYVVAEVELAKKLLNWMPKKGIKEMCLDGWKWQQLNPKGYEE